MTQSELSHPDKATPHHNHSDDAFAPHTDTQCLRCPKMNTRKRQSLMALCLDNDWRREGGFEPLIRFKAV